MKETLGHPGQRKSCFRLIKTLKMVQARREKTKYATVCSSFITSSARPEKGLIDSFFIFQLSNSWRNSHFIQPRI